MRLIDRTGQRYERLTVVSRAPNMSQSDTNARWNCRCDCGRMAISYGQDLARGKSKSCGCLSSERAFKHGRYRDPVYAVWRQIKQRCSNPRSDAYANYGARGITVDPSWSDFGAFIRDMGEPPNGASLDRIDNNGPYSKENCRWATPKQQHNNKRTNRLVTAFGRTQTLMQWADETGLNWFTLRSRMDKYGWSIERALTEPAQKTGA